MTPVPIRTPAGSELLGVLGEGVRTVRFRMLGPLRVRNGTNWVSVAAGQQRLVLAVLLADAGQVVTTERLVDAVWGDQPPRRALNTVHAYVMRLRRLLGDGVLATRDRGYELVVDRDDVDAMVFERLVASGRRELDAGRPGTGATRLARALALWRGPAYADVPASPTLNLRVAHLDQVRLAAQEDHLAALLELGRHADVVDELHHLAEESPLRERRWVLLMRALNRCGRRAEALEAFHRARRVLLDDLGLEPGPELRKQQRTILAAEPAPPVAVQSSVAPAQLPADVAWFTGRDDELMRLDEVLQADRDESAAVVISAIDGAAGVGKTALAVHWAHRVRDRFGDGQLYVDLRGHADHPPVRPVEVLAWFLRALGVPAERVPSNVEEASGLYRSLLTSRRVLVVLDNARDPEQVRPLLPGSTGCLALVTSRDRLGGLVARDGAIPVTLDVLTDAEAHTLLTRLLGADRVHAQSDASAELARLCGNLPLALRLAAANLSTRPQASIGGYAIRLAGDRLGGLDVHGDPHAGVRAAFDMSYAALSPAARRLFRLLSLAPGPDVTAGVAGALAGTDPATAARELDRLATAHLVHERAPGRFALHDLLRHYALERAAEDESETGRRAAQDRFYDYCLRHVDAAARMILPGLLRLPLPGHDHAAVLPFDDDLQASTWLAAEQANLVAAVRHAADNGLHHHAWRLADSLRGFLHLRLQLVEWHEVGHAAQAAAEALGDPAARAAALVSLASLSYLRGHCEQAIDNHRQALALARQAGWVEGESYILGDLGAMYGSLGRLGRAADYLARGLAIDRRAGLRDGEAVKLSNLGVIYIDTGRLEEAVRHLLQALALREEAKASTGISRTRMALGRAYHALGRFDEALTALNKALAVQREIGDRGGESGTLHFLAVLYRDTGRYVEALDLADQAVTIAVDAGEQEPQAYARAARASVHHHQGDEGAALDGYQQALRAARELGDRVIEADVLVGLAAVLGSSGHAEEALALARHGGYRLLEGQALTVLAAIELGQGQAAAAHDHAEQALRIHTGTGHRLGQALAHLMVGRALRDTGSSAGADSHEIAARALFKEIGIDPDPHLAALTTR